MSYTGYVHSPRRRVLRPLKSHFRDEALTTCDTVLKQTPEVRGFRRAHAVHTVVAGHHVNTVSATCRFANSALRKWTASGA
jgi:hypothetical protein